MKTFNVIAVMLYFIFSYSTVQSQTKTSLLYNGPVASKFNIVFMGDGFTSAEQSAYNTLVENYFNAIFTHNNGDLDNVLSELKDAFNVYRVNHNSTQSGVNKYTCSVSGCAANSVTKNTVYGFRYSGCWDCCWMNWGTAEETKVNNALSAVGLSSANYIVMILNESGFGGCSAGRILSITKSVPNNVLMHELGHSIGGLADEYDKPGCYSGTNPSTRNVDINANNSKWNLFAKSTTTTGNPVEYNVSQINGQNKGAIYSNDCIHRPSNNSAMRDNTNLFNPPSYDEFWVRNKPRSNYNFNKVHTGDFVGSEAADVLVHYGSYMSAYAVGVPEGFTGDGMDTRITSSYMTTNNFTGTGGTWNINENDRVYIGDWSGDGKDDLVLFYPNGASSKLGLMKATTTGFTSQKIFTGSLPSWSMRNNDQFFLADFDGDGKKDIYVFNASDWVFGYWGMLKSTGANLTFVKRYDEYLPGNYMHSSDKYYVADLNGDLKEDIVLYKPSAGCTRLFKSNGTDLSLSAEYFGSLPGWTNAIDDKFYIADFNGDGKDDLYVYNGKNWGPEYLLMLKSNGNNYEYIIRYDNNLSGWDMQNNDSFYVSDCNGDGKEDLIVYNHQDWSTQYLGRCISNGTGLSCGLQDDWVGGWNLGPNDNLQIADAKTGSDRLLINNTDWIGWFIPSGSSISLGAMYKGYIHTFKHHDHGWY